MNNTRFRFTTSLLVTILLLFSITAVYAQGSGHSQNTADVFKPISITSKSYAQLERVDVQDDHAGQIITYTIEVFNGDARDLSFIDYWTRIVTNQGMSYSVKYLETPNEMILPNTSNKYTFYARIGSELKLSDLRIQLIKWDFSTTDYQINLGTFQIPENYSAVTPANIPLIQSVSGHKLKTMITQSYINSTSNDHHLTIDYSIKNVGTRSIDVPDYNYLIKTNDGLLFPLETNAGGMKLNPLTTSVVTLNGALPAAVEDLNNLQLIVTRDVHGAEIQSVPIGAYALPKSEVKEDSYDKEHNYSNASGDYVIKLKSVQRLPWEDTDIISADLSVYNADTKTLPLLNIDGYFVLDNVKLSNIKPHIVDLDKVIGIQSGQESNHIIYAKVPYTYDFSTLKLVIEEVSDTNADAKKIIAEFNYEYTDLALPTIQNGKSYSITNVGNRSDVRVSDIHTYTGHLTDLYYIELELTNKEKRHSNISQLSGYFRSKDDIYYPAAISSIDQKVSPNGKILVSFWSELPKGQRIDELDIILGQSLDGDELASSGGQSDAFMKAVTYELPEENKQLNEDFIGFNISNYTLNFNRLRTGLFLDGSDLKGEINFNYDLFVDNQYEVYNKDHKLVIEFIDTNVKYSKAFELEKDFTLGEANQFRMIVDVEGISVLVKNFDDYTINIYDEYNGHRKLIATRTLDWFTYYN